MVFVFTVAMISFAYVLTVNTRNRRQLKNLRNQVLELEQLLEMALIYGKEQKESEEKARQESESTGKKE
jgi:nitrate reductase NapAB chaperone NapD